MYQNCDKQRRYAWAIYYDMVRGRHENDYTNYRTIVRHITEAEMPVHIVNELKEMADKLKKTWECPICMDIIEKEKLEITPCGHFYCKPCLDQLKSTADAKCAMCRRKFKQSVSTRGSDGSE
jgi:late competence protein required for DNA uptake (superfamily II DNA/RNA helicase)